MSLNEQNSTDVKTNEPSEAPSLPSRYVIKRLLGQGGMGKVFEAFDQQLERTVAIKIINISDARNDNFNQRFTREAKALSQLNHPGIVKILNFGISESGSYYQILEFLEGETLATVLAQNSPLGLARFYQIFSQILSALLHAHENGIIHRDIKPSNIMILESGGTLSARLLDFGIARFETEDAGSTLTNTVFFIGSPSYMSPEQCKGFKADARSDIFSIGCVMYEAITGSPPHTGNSSMDIMYKQMNQAAPALATKGKSPVERALGKLIDSCLQIDPSDRPSSIQLLITELDDLLKNVSADQFFELSKPVKPSLRVATLVVACLIAALSCGAYALFSNKKMAFNSNEKEELSIRKKNDAKLEHAKNQVKDVYQLLHRAKNVKEREDYAQVLLEKWEDYIKLLALQRHSSPSPEDWQLALQQFETENDGYRAAKVYTYIAALRWAKGDYKGARLLLEKARQCNFGSARFHGEIELLICGNDILLCQFEAAASNLDEVMKYYRRIVADSPGGNLKSHLMNTHRADDGLGDFSAGMFNYLELENLPGGSKAEFDFLNKLAACYLEMEQLDACQRQLSLVDSLARKFPNSRVQFKETFNETNRLKSALNSQKK